VQDPLLAETTETRDDLFAHTGHLGATILAHAVNNLIDLWALVHDWLPAPDA